MTRTTVMPLTIIPSAEIPPAVIPPAMRPSTRGVPKPHWGRFFRLAVLTTVMTSVIVLWLLLAGLPALAAPPRDVVHTWKRLYYGKLDGKESLLSRRVSTEPSRRWGTWTETGTWTCSSGGGMGA